MSDRISKQQKVRQSVLDAQRHQQKVRLSTEVFVGMAMTMIDGQRRRSHPTPKST